MYNHEGRCVKTNMLDICEGFRQYMSADIGERSMQMDKTGNKKV
jgi:hypothetical protein